MYHILIFIIYAIISNSEMICFIPHYRDQTAIAKSLLRILHGNLLTQEKNSVEKDNPSLCCKALFLAQTSIWETRVQSQGREDPLEKEMATHSGTLA